MTQGLTRRDTILAATRAAILAGLASASFPQSVLAQSDITVDQFLMLSETLTEKQNLDSDNAKVLLAGFIAAGSGDALKGLIAGDQKTNDKDLKAAIVAAWYSGVYDDNGTEKVATYDEALVWDALPFTKPQGECGGDLGYWSQPPEKN